MNLEQLLQVLGYEPKTKVDVLLLVHQQVQQVEIFASTVAEAKGLSGFTQLLGLGQAYNWEKIRGFSIPGAVAIESHRLEAQVLIVQINS